MDSIEKLKFDLKKMIIEICDKDELIPEDIADNEILFGPGTTLELDSLDALQISMELNHRYGLKITDSKKLKKIMANINDLAREISNQ